MRRPRDLSRGFTCKNTTDEAIEPFSVMELVVDSFTSRAVNTRDDDLLLYVGKPGTAASLSNPYAFVFNGPTTIGARGYGVCLFPPCDALVVPSGSIYTSIGRRLGPTDGSWFLHAAGSGFSMVAGSPFVFGSGDGPRIGLVERNPNYQVKYLSCAGISSVDSVAAGGYLPMFGENVISHPIFSTPEHVATVSEAGHYHGVLSASVRCAVLGTEIILSVRAQRPSGDPPRQYSLIPQWNGSEAQKPDGDEYSPHPYANICFPFSFYLESGDQFYAINASSVAIDLKYMNIYVATTNANDSGVGTYQGYANI